MQLVYYAHSYREEDARVTRFFLELVTQQSFTISLDPPSDELNSAKLERHLRSSDGLIAVLTTREAGAYSKYIYYEIMLAVRARKPILVFVEDDLPNDVLPHNILQLRFSRRFYGRQVRELRYALSTFGALLGDDPPSRYGAYTSARSCLLGGFDEQSGAAQDAVDRALARHRYEPLVVEAFGSFPSADPRWFTILSDVDLAICNLDAPATNAQYLAGVVQAAFVPTINMTAKPLPTTWVPVELAPCSPSIEEPFDDLLEHQLVVFEQDFFELGDPDQGDSYVLALIEADARRHSTGTFGTAGAHFMGDQINISQSQVGAVGDNNVVANNTFQQLWSQVESGIDLDQLANELQRLREALRGEAATAEQAAALGEAAQAELAARDGDGPTALQRLKAAGKWLLQKAEEIGTPIAVAALRAALGMT